MDNFEKAKRHHTKGSYIFGFWHQNIVSSALGHRGRPHIVMISSSKDGEIATTVANKFGFKTVRGSSTRGGQKALKEMIRLLNSGLPAAITVDGPKGPPKEVKDGIVELAKLKSISIVPLRAIPQKFWFFKKSWDKFRIPYPFTKIIIEYGTPIFVPAGTKRDEFEKIKNCLANELNKAK